MKQAVTTHPVKSQEEVAAQLSNTLKQHLDNGKKVLWFVSGGSSLPIAAQALQNLEKSDTNRLVAMLVDDYRDPAQPSGNNWTKLRALNSTLPVTAVFLNAARSLESLTAEYTGHVTRQIGWAEVLIGQFGLGAGFHTGGIQPHSPAASTPALVAGYNDNDIERITITPALIGRLDVAFINSMGEGKRPLVEHFLVSGADIYDEPTQALKTARKTYVYSDVLPEG